VSALTAAATVGAVTYVLLPCRPGQQRHIYGRDPDPRRSVKSADQFAAAAGRQPDAPPPTARGDGRARAEPGRHLRMAWPPPSRARPGMAAVACGSDNYCSLRSKL